jgi:hypothetical protein
VFYFSVLTGVTLIKVFLLFFWLLCSLYYTMFYISMYYYVFLLYWVVYTEVIGRNMFISFSHFLWEV